MRSEGSKRWDKQYYRRSKEGGDEVLGGCLPREVQHHHQQQQASSSTTPLSQTSWLPSWCRLFHKKPKKPPTGEKGGGGGEGRFTVISCDSQVCDHLKNTSNFLFFNFVIEPKTCSGKQGKGVARTSHTCLPSPPGKNFPKTTFRPLLLKPESFIWPGFLQSDFVSPEY